MADFRSILNEILKWEGGIANVQGDLGGLTHSGVTLNTYRMYFGNDKTASDLMNMTKGQLEYIFKKGFWEKCKGDDIKNQSVAHLLVDFSYMSGPKTAIKYLQKILGVAQDGIIGNVTLAALNKMDSEMLFYKLFNERQNYFYYICERRQENNKFLRGWLRRLFSIKYSK